jgi:hypothetical protein
MWISAKNAYSKYLIIRNNSLLIFDSDMPVNENRVLNEFLSRKRTNPATLGGGV